MVVGKRGFVVALLLVASLGLADAHATSAAEPDPAPTATSTTEPSPTPTPTPTPTTTPPPPPPRPVPQAGPVYLPASKVKLRKVSGGTSIVKGKSPVYGTHGRLVRYTVEVQTKMPNKKLSAIQLEAVTRWAFGDEQRGWTARGKRRMQRVENPRAARLRIVLAKPSKVDSLCRKGGAYTAGKWSCFNGFKFAALNKTRWLKGSVKGTFPSINEYRAYLVNHEVGHGLGYKHRGCPRKGALANVMLQQSRVLYGCRANGWPYP